MSNSALQVFKFDSHRVRVVSDNPEKPLFVAVDAARVLGYKRPSDAYRKLKGTAKHRTLSTSGGGQKLRVVGEPDLYRLVFGSKLDSAIAFQDWVYEEVLPSIRQTGGFQLETPTEKEQLLLTDGRKALSNGVKQLTRVLKRNGKDTHFQDVWKLVHLKSGMQSIEQATPEQIETAMTYVGEVLEGELLAPDLPVGMVMVNKNHLDGMLVSLKLQKENLKSFMKLEREAVCNAEIMQVMVDKTLGVRHEISQTRYKMHDCINDASMIADIVERQLNI